MQESSDVINRGGGVSFCKGAVLPVFRNSHIGDETVPFMMEPSYPKKIRYLFIGEEPRHLTLLHGWVIIYHRITLVLCVITYPYAWVKIPYEPFQ